MKKSMKDLFSDVVVGILRPFIFILMSREIKVVASGEVIDKKRDPFILISNHFNTWDSFVIMKNIKSPIRFVATEIAYLDFSKKIGMGILARTIRKRVGKHDFKATKEIFRYLQAGYSIGLFPEGDNTFYGETLDMYENTGRLLKKANVDVILAKQQGGYISQPRWADYFSKKGVIHTHTKTLITKEELANLSEEEINEIVKQAIYNNDYDFQREQMIDLDRKKRAEGIERLVYYCNKCGSVLTVFGEEHDMICSSCGKIGTINEYEFIEGNTFDNLVDYNHFQYSKIEDVINSEFVFVVTLNKVDTKKLKNHKLGQYRLHYKDKVLTLTSKQSMYTFELSKMKYPVNTMRHSFSFDYEGITYNFTDIRHQFVLYEMCRYINGSYKVK